MGRCLHASNGAKEKAINRRGAEGEERKASLDVQGEVWRTLRAVIACFTERCENEGRRDHSLAS